MADPPIAASLADRLRRLTSARVGLGRVHNALPTRAMLDFDLAHARARDAVHAELPADFAAGLGAIDLSSQADDRATYLKRPDLGRKLAAESAARLATSERGGIAIVLADGLSAAAMIAHGEPMLAALRDRLGDEALRQPIVARQARVALGDEIGAMLAAEAVVALIGERPGLSAPRQPRCLYQLGAACGHAR